MTRLGLGFVDVAALRRLRPAWEALCDRSPRTTAFQRPDWMLPWMRYFGPREPWIMAVWDRAALVGIAPLFIYGARGEERAVALLGAGISDYLDLICDPARGRQVASEVLVALSARRTRWQRCKLEDVPADSPLCAAPTPPALDSTLEKSGDWWRLDIGARGEPFAWLAPRRRTKILAELRRADRDVGVSLGRTTTETFARDWAILEDLHAARWRERGERGMLATPELRAFHREVAWEFLGRDRLALYILWFAGRPAASLYGFEDGRTIYYYLGGFDPAHARYSPGRLVVGLAAEDASRRGANVLDFLRGDEPYKRAWGAQPHPRMLRVLRPR